MKNVILFCLLIIGSLFSCEKSSIKDSNSAVILANTCGGTVIKFISVDFGEEWVDNFGDAQSYENVVLTNDLESEGYQDGDSISFNFKEVDILEGNLCDIGGLPHTKVELTNLNKLK